jgi:hypothetical protein
LKNALGTGALEGELVLIDPKEKPTEDNDRKISAFCDKLKRIWE